MCAGEASCICMQSTGIMEWRTRLILMVQNWRKRRECTLAHPWLQIKSHFTAVSKSDTSWSRYWSQFETPSLFSKSWHFSLMFDKNEYKRCTWWQPCSRKVCCYAPAGMPSKILKALQSWITLMLTVLDYISGHCKLHKYTWCLLLW